MRQQINVMKTLLRNASACNKPSSLVWSDNLTLPGGFSAGGLRDWAALTNFGADDYVRQDVRRRESEYDRYSDLFSKRVSDECSTYVASHTYPSSILGRAFFSSRSFMSERIVLISLNSLFHWYPEGSTTLPTHFNLNDQYLHWKVASNSPLEIIYSYHIKALNFRGCTMLAYDPSLKKVYHGNCIDVAAESVKSSLGIRLHEQYAKYLLQGMVGQLEIMARGVVHAS